MKSILGFFRSVRLAVVLIVYMAIFSLLASLIPQSQDRSFYAAHFPAPLAWIITGSGFSAFFRSPLFLVPAGLFFINLAVCTVDRFLRELKKQERRHGPDILHVGILLLCIGGLVSFEGRQSGSVLLSNGDAVRLSTDRVLEMTDFAYRAYPDGRPEDWTSTVRLYSGSKVEIPSYAIRVNHPLRLGLLSIYQVSHEIQRALVLQDSQGGVHSLARGEETQAGEASIQLLDPGKPGESASVRLRDASGERVAKLGVGDPVGTMTVAGVRELEFSGLEAVLDPGFPLVLASLIIAALGLFLTFFQKLRSMGVTTA